MKLLYFAWVREKLGCSEETLTLPPEVRTARQLASYLAARSPAYAGVFGAPDGLNLAINQEHASWDQELAAAHEVAFFPPVTGG